MVFYIHHYINGEYLQILVIFLNLIIIDIQVIEEILLGLCRNLKVYEFIIEYLECWGKKNLKFDIDQKIISIFHWKVSPTGAEIKWLVDEWWFIYICS